MITNWILFIIVGYAIMTVSSVQYNQRCTFSSGTCNWSIGRRWHMTNDGNKYGNILIADGESNEDKRVGFTDAIMSSWLSPSSSCSFNIRLTFRFVIQNQHDEIEVFVIQKNDTRLSRVGQWKAVVGINNNSSDEIEPIWQQGNVTFRTIGDYRIDIQVRHLPDDDDYALAWFALDDIRIENCPIIVVNTTTRTQEMTTTTTTTIIMTTLRSIPSHSNEHNATLVNVSSDLSRWKFDDSMLSFSDDRQSSSSPRLSLLTLILYLLCALIAFTLLIILLAIIIFTYRKHCLASTSTIDHRYRFDQNKKTNRIGIQIDNLDRDGHSETTTDIVRPCF